MGEVTISCPRCARQTTLSTPMQRSADEFCAECDFPLFWAPASDRAESGSGELRDTERLPDASCARCGMDNPVGSRFCNVCGEQL